MSYPEPSKGRNELFWRIVLIAIGVGLLCALLASCNVVDKFFLPEEPGSMPPIGDVVETIGHGTSWGPVGGAIITLLGAAWWYIRRRRRRVAP